MTTARLEEFCTPPLGAGQLFAPTEKLRHLWSIPNTHGWQECLWCRSRRKAPASEIPRMDITTPFPGQ